MSARRRTAAEESLWAQYDAAIDPAIVALQKFARLYRQCMPDELSIDTERWFACWIAQILMDVDIDLERAVQSMADDGLTLYDDPIPISRMWAAERRQNGGEKL
jgi:hypothetical protein